MILDEDGTVSSIRLHTRQQVSDNSTGEVINDKIVITIIADFVSGDVPDSSQLDLFLARIYNRTSGG